MTESEWLASEDPPAMLDHLLRRNDAGLIASEKYLERNGPNDRKLRLFACACCRQIWDLLTDERSRNAVEVAERYADGLITAEDLARAEDLASATRAARAARAACAASTTSAVSAARAACEACAAAVSVLTRWAAAEAAWAAAEVAQADLLRDIIGNPFRPVTCRQTGNRLGTDTVMVRGDGRLVGCDCAWFTPTVLAIAQSAYEEWRGDGSLDPVTLAILADALEDAGCDNEDILRHLRGCEVCWGGCFGDANRFPGSFCAFCSGTGWVPMQGPHVRGCWALDLILGKE